ncbi:MAG: MMPL family transporter [Tepidisphaeraceae bacterium]
MGSTTRALTYDPSLPDRGSAAANAAIERRYGNGGMSFPYVVVAQLPRQGMVSPPSTRRLARLISRMFRARVVSYGSTRDRSFVSADGRTTFALVFTAPTFDTDATTTHRVARLERFAGARGMRVYVTGLSALMRDASDGRELSLLFETLVGVLGALAVLIAVFFSPLALVPLVTALAAVPTTFLLLGGLTRITEVSFLAQYLVALIGLGLSIDYSLVVVMRWREEQCPGVPDDERVMRAMATAGRTVVLSGATVAVGLSALLVLPVPFVSSAGYGGMLIPIVSVAVALTLLPVLLATVGPRLERRRCRHAATADADRGWHRWGRCVVRHRWLAAVTGLLVVGTLSFAATRVHLGLPRADTVGVMDSADGGLLLLRRAGIGTGVMTPTEVVVPIERLDEVVGRLRRVPGVAGVVAPRTWWRDGSALAAVLPTGGSEESTRIVAPVRSALDDVPGALVGGAPAYAHDLTDAVLDGLPAVVVLLSVATTLLLAFALRSLVLPLKALIVNALSISAAWGAMTLCWQQGWGSHLLWGVHATGSLQAWIPLMVFAFLWGLSMDYEIIVLARMREEYDRTGSTRRAVISGVGRTGRLVTSGALILCITFVSMSLAPDLQVKILATGLGVGILLDATVVRAMLVPATVAIFGRFNWWWPDGRRQRRRSRRNR